MTFGSLIDGTPAQQVFCERSCMPATSACSPVCDELLSDSCAAKDCFTFPTWIISKQNRSAGRQDELAEPVIGTVGDAPA
jgi:hypothetical protein